VDGRENRETERRYGLANKRVAFPEPQQKLLEPPKRAYLAERDCYIMHPNPHDVSGQSTDSAVPTVAASLEKRRHAESYHCVQS
jgi:hypothetical protein